MAIRASLHLFNLRLLPQCHLYPLSPHPFNPRPLRPCSLYLRHLLHPCSQRLSSPLPPILNHLLALSLHSHQRPRDPARSLTPPSLWPLSPCLSKPPLLNVPRSTASAATVSSP